MTPEKLTAQPIDVSPHNIIDIAATDLAIHNAKPVVPITTAPGRDWAEATHRMMDGVGIAWKGFWKFVKLGICVGLDILDFFIGRILGFGIAFDVGCALITAALWGKSGWWALWEVADITEQIDGFLPTCTIIALRSWHND